MKLVQNMEDNQAADTVVAFIMEHPELSDDLSRIFRSKKLVTVAEIIEDGVKKQLNSKTGDIWFKYLTYF